MIPFFLPVKLLVFDSGIGGLTLYPSLKRQLPNAQLCYLSDRAGFPYGTKSDTWLANRLKKVLQQAVHTFNPDILILACNTASTQISHVRENLPIPVVGLEPAIKPAAEYSKSKEIMVFATPTMCAHNGLDKLIDQFAKDCKIHRVGDPLFAEAAEKLMTTSNQSEQQNWVQKVSDSLSGYKHKSKDVDAIVLGCTHYPILKQIFIQFWPEPCHIFDSSEAVGRQTIRIAKNLFADISPLPEQSKQLAKYPKWKNTNLYFSTHHSPYSSFTETDFQPNPDFDIHILPANDIASIARDYAELMNFSEFLMA